MTNILIPISLFIVSLTLSFFAAQFAFVSFVIGALINIYVNRRKKSEATETGNGDQDILLIRASIALMTPSFIFVAVILIGMLGVHL